MQTLFAMFGFALITAFTPGPNNTMLMVSGANWGFWPSLPHVMGITIGFPLMVFAVGMGLGGVFDAYPVLHDILKYVAFAYLLYLAWKLANAGRHDASGARVGKPMSFTAAALFQWVNPKAWMMAIGAMALYVPAGGDVLHAVLLLVLVFASTALPSASVWCLFGTGIARFLDSERRVAIFNAVMALLLVVSMVPTLL
ncbi:LysE family translocator [Kaistia dalseonensis]|uniref:Threonine/homoserine/homoserine lactone efflux protein n=1 Tax=Kaistia dalseonensis TaxID=410840 RepID=A0ABU0H1B9_9HYPH|nr:LysE family translocator [Kaistia dalseonensis]MCX5493543.1 LysE family translocator [Kaistia dalseonensis]MDQ0436103.1 threonine/homoserine/homoserine lactone efflux protein [Kaistia dalseonensis]